MKHPALRFLHLAHRWLGICAGVLVLVWFVSGLVMLYVPFPKLDVDTRVAHLDTLRTDAIQFSPAEAARACRSTPRGGRIAMTAGRPAYHFATRDGACSVWADTGAALGPVAPDMALRAARNFLPGVPLSGPETIERDQWTVYTTYNAHRPLHVFQAADAAATELYVSSRSGEVVNRTTRLERVAGWVGTVPHWIYFTPLRGEDTRSWRMLVLWLPPVALLTVLLGLALGIQRLRLRHPYPRGQVTPYRGWKRWHHLLGLGAGGFALTWLLSGWLSNHPFGLLEFSSLPPGSAERLAGGPFKPSDSVELLRRQLAHVPDAREAEWSRFAGRSYLEVRSPGRSQRLDDNAAPARPIPPETLARAIHDIEGKPIARVELIHEADLYHYGRRNPAVLPAARIRLADEQDTTWYLDPASGRVLARIDNANRLHRWVFNGLHRLDFPPLAALPALREAVITLLCLLGITLASTGCVLGWRRLRHRKPTP